MAKMLHVFCYDVSSDKARRRIAGRLEDQGLRVQGSVFEVRIDRAGAARLARSLARHLGPGDSLRVYPAPEPVAETVVSYGATPPPVSGDYVLL